MTEDFDIDRVAVKRYWLIQWWLFWFCFFGGLAVGLIGPAISAIAEVSFAIAIEVSLAWYLILWTFSSFVAGVVLFLFLSWLCRCQANSLRYRLDGSVLRVDGGVFFLFRKSIPVERITDVALVQGPLLRILGIWAMRIQTAGSPQVEATLYGVRNPEKVRDLILASRQQKSDGT